MPSSHKFIVTKTAPFWWLLRCHQQDRHSDTFLTGSSVVNVDSAVWGWRCACPLRRHCKVKLAFGKKTAFHTKELESWLKGCVNRQQSKYLDLVPSRFTLCFNMGDFHKTKLIFKTSHLFMNAWVVSRQQTVLGWAVLSSFSNRDSYFTEVWSCFFLEKVFQIITLASFPNHWYPYPFRHYAGYFFFLFLSSWHRFRSSVEKEPQLRKLLSDLAVEHCLELMLSGPSLLWAVLSLGRWSWVV